MNTKHLILFVALSLIVIPFVGCSNGQVSLHGKVVFSDDGTPVPTGAICFTDGTNVSRGTINVDGTFVMGVTKLDDGIPPGHYAVYFVGVEVPIPDNEMDTKPLIDRKYTHPDTSGLEADVTATTKTIEFQLDRFKPGK